LHFSLQAVVFPVLTFAKANEDAGSFGLIQQPNPEEALT
jgi:hypothetical protein